MSSNMSLEVSGCEQAAQHLQQGVLRTAARADGLAARYEAVANDGSASAQAREAALLLSTAEDHLNEERLQQAAESANEAINAFRAQDDRTGLADASRVFLGARRLQRNLEEAIQVAKRELAFFQERGEKRGQACMMLSLGEIALDGAGDLTHAEAAVMLLQAANLFAQAGDSHMEAIALMAASSANSVMGSNGHGKRFFAQAERFAQRALDIFGKLQDQCGQGKAYHALAVVSVYGGDVAAGIAHARDALKSWQTLGSRRLEAFEQHCLAMWLIANSSYDEALEAAQAVQVLFEELQYGRGYISAALANRVQALLEKADVEKALEVAREALTQAENSDDTTAKASALQMLCACKLSSGDTREALSHSRSALESIRLLSPSGARELWEAAVLQKIASLHLAAGDLAGAAAMSSEAATLCKTAGSRCEEAKAMCFLCDVYISSGKHDDAIRTSNDARELFADEGSLQGEATACLCISAAMAAKGDSRRAAASARTALELSQEADDDRGKADAFLTLARLAVHHGDFGAAAIAARHGRHLARELHGPAGERAHLAVAAQAAFCSAMYGPGVPIGLRKPDQQWNEAHDLAHEFLELARSLEDDLLVTDALHGLAQVHMGMKDYSQVMRCLDEGLELCEKWHSTASLGSSEGAMLLLLAQLHIAQGARSKALEVLPQALDLFEASKDARGQAMARDLLKQLGKRQKTTK